MKPRPSLSSRQREIMRLILRGKADKEISTALGISKGTLKNHLARIFLKLGANSRAHAVAIFLSE
jgi:DNA-binding CsgD family transcriptional regulator